MKILIEKIKSKIIISEKIKSRKKLIIILSLFLIAVIMVLVLAGSQNKSSCIAGEKVLLKGNTLTISDLEEYNGNQLQGKLCHLTLNSADMTTDYYFDEAAMIKIRGGNNMEIGNGCLVYRIGNMFTSDEVCFGDKAVFREKDTENKEENGIFNELLRRQEVISVTVTPVISSLVSSIPQASHSSYSTGNMSAVNLLGTRWRYQIDVGGGVGGILTFGKDENGKLTGTFTESGPEGNKEKFFIGSLEKDKFLLTLEDFSTFKLTLSSDGRTMTGKPLEENKDIYYPDNFFKATLEK